MRLHACAVVDVRGDRQVVTIAVDPGPPPRLLWRTPDGETRTFTAATLWDVVLAWRAALEARGWQASIRAAGATVWAHPSAAPGAHGGLPVRALRIGHPPGPCEDGWSALAPGLTASVASQAAHHRAWLESLG